MYIYMYICAIVLGECKYMAYIYIYIYIVVKMLCLWLINLAVHVMQYKSKY